MTDPRPTFPLIDEPWIAVLDRDGRQRLVSLHEVFAEAHDLRAVVGDIPTQTIAILRLLLAILHCAVDGPADDPEWRRLWQRPHLPGDAVDGYLDEYRDRFDLLHPVTPFYQVADLRTAKDEAVGLERLIADVPNGTPYLTARLGAGLARIRPDEAARWLVHCQAFDTSGIKSGAVGDPRVKGGKGYPIGTGWCGALGAVFLEGATLRETLLLNLIPEHWPLLARGSDDAPVWERDPQAAAEEDPRARGPYGPLSLYTWQSRRIRLFGDVDGITGALICNGDRLESIDRHHLEPMTAWRRSEAKEKELKRSPVYVPARHDPGRSLWRGLHALLPTSARPAAGTAAAQLAPPVAQWLAHLRVDQLIPAEARVMLRAVAAVYGTQQSVIDQIIDDAVTVSVQAFHPDAGLRTLIIDGAADAEAAVKGLRTLAANLTRAAGGRGDAPADAGARAAATAFTVLDQDFRRWLAGLSGDSDLAAVRADWQTMVRRSVQRLGADLVGQAGPAAWAGREIGGDKPQFVCAPLADLWFRRHLHRVLPLAFTSMDTFPTPQDEEPLT